MTRLRDLRGPQEYKESSSCLGPFGDLGPSVGEGWARGGRGGGRAGGVYVNGGE